MTSRLSPREKHQAAILSLSLLQGCGELKHIANRPKNMPAMEGALVVPPNVVAVIIGLILIVINIRRMSSDATDTQKSPMGFSIFLQFAGTIGIALAVMLLLWRLIEDWVVILGPSLGVAAAAAFPAERQHKVARLSAVTTIAAVACAWIFF